MSLPGRWLLVDFFLMVLIALVITNVRILQRWKFSGRFKKMGSRISLLRLWGATFLVLLYHVLAGWKEYDQVDGLSDGYLLV